MDGIIISYFKAQIYKLFQKPSCYLVEGKRNLKFLTGLEFGRIHAVATVTDS